MNGSDKGSAGRHVGPRRRCASMRRRPRAARRPSPGETPRSCGCPTTTFSSIAISAKTTRRPSRTSSGAGNGRLTTVGIDIGSSTSHLLFAKVTLQRQAQGLSSRFVVDRPRNRVALADHADAVSARRHASTRPGSAVSSTHCYDAPGIARERRRQRRGDPHRRSDQAQERPRDRRAVRRRSRQVRLRHRRPQARMHARRARLGRRRAVAAAREPACCMSISAAARPSSP